jgi:hypothetical protein
MDTRLWYDICMLMCMLAMVYVGSTKRLGIYLSFL